MTPLSEKIPEHVPGDLVIDFDPVAGPEVRNFPPTSVTGFRDRFPIFYTPYGGGYWVLTRYADIRWAFENPEIFPQQGTLNESWSGRRHIPLRLNPPEHHTYRKMLMGLFSPRRLKAMEPMLRQSARDRIDEFKSRGACDLMQDYAITLPAATFCALIGVPLSDFETFHKLGKGMVYEAEAVAREQGAEAGRKYRAELLNRIETIIADLIPVKRANQGDDVISYLLNATVNDRPVTEDEITNIVTLLFWAGTDSTAGMIGYVLAYLAKNPELRRRLVTDASLIPKATDELIRYHAFHHIVRDVAKDVEVHGVTLKRGDRVLLHTGGANHDPEAFADPETVDISRKLAGHVTFGAGIHRCLGAPVARLEVQVAVDELHAVIPDYRITDGGQIEYQFGQQKITTKHVPVTFDPVPA